VLAVGVIIAVSAMTSMEPARSVAEAREGARTVETTVDDVSATLRLEPGGLGTNRVEVLLESRGEPIPASNANLRLTYLESEIGDVNIALESVGEGKFVAEEVLLGVSGAWRAEVTASRLDGFDVRLPFLFQMGTAEATGSPLPEDTARLLWIAMWMALAALFHAVALRLRGRHATGTSALQWSGSAFVVLAMLAVTSTGPFALGGSALSGNPLPPSAEILARGEEVYQEHCVACHGTNGTGDGPTAVEGGFAGVRLDLTQHVPVHSDAQLRGYIENGIPDTPMPAWGGTLSSDDIWSVIHYLRELAARAR
jgi:mono/diheme cytochrome c family protein/nitrogen fixation protein FixH